MRDLINALADLFGQQNSGQITHWVNEQYLFESVIDGVTISLRDMDCQDVIKVVLTACSELSLTLNMLTNGMWLVPVLTGNQLAIKATLEVRPELFKMVLGSSVKIIDESVAYEGDIVERFGSDQHIRLTSKSNESQPLSCIFINYTVDYDGDEQPFSIQMTGAELDEVRRIYLQNKYNGANPFTTSHWQHLLLSSVYRRLFNDAIFSSIESAISSDSAVKYRLLARFGHDEIEEEKSHQTEYFYSDYGHIVGRKVVRHNVVDLLAAKRNDQPAVTRPADNTSQESPTAQVVAFVKPEKDPNYSDDAITEWGEF